MARKDPTKLHPENYHIIRYVSGDVFEGFHKGNHIGAGGDTLSYNPIGVDVPDHWRTFTKDEHPRIIEHMQNNPEVRILLTREYTTYIQKCAYTPEIRENIVKKLEKLYNQYDKVGFFAKVSFKYKIWKLKCELKSLGWFPEPKEFVDSLPKYPVDHQIEIE